ncbi:hypothetical protein GIB67_022791 [Kingdonia uniflora]|uniref:Uncharacterized protein n=1 Tax=Kingdonia uniflora TaxID=39325 RepID=A0A7J7P6Z0_9MAGN|nr:hypothetical protein GIB67_022791 [Kingdonia uniflora]
MVASYGSCGDKVCRCAETLDEITVSEALFVMEFRGGLDGAYGDVFKAEVGAVICLVKFWKEVVIMDARKSPKKVMSPCDVEALKKCLEENKGDYLKCQAQVESFRTSCNIKKPNSVDEPSPTLGPSVKTDK